MVFYSSFKSSMYRSIWKRLPPLPKTRAEIDLTGDWVNSLSGERFLLRNEGSSDRILIFSTDAMLHLLCNLEAIYADGTFQVCPSMFMQLFTINGFIHGQQFPLVYALLPSKTRADYNRMFTYLKEELQGQTCRWVHRCWDSRMLLPPLSVYGGRSRLSGWLICTKMMLPPETSSTKLLHYPSSLQASLG